MGKEKDKIIIINYNNYVYYEIVYIIQSFFNDNVKTNYLTNDICNYF